MIATAKIVRCCVKCSECGDCYTHTLDELRDLLTAIHIEISNYGEALIQKVQYGFAKFCITEAAVDRLLRLKETVLNYYHSLRTKAMMCLCDSEFQRVKEKIGRIIDLGRCKSSGLTDIRYNNDSFNQWIASNPNCVAYETWEKGIIACNPTFIISVTTEYQRVIRTLHAVATKDTSGCVVKLLAYAHKAACDRKLTASATNTSKCKVELKALVKQHKCDLSLAVYSKLLQCNLSFKAISTVLGCGGKFSLDASGSPMLRIGARTSLVQDIVKLAGGTWQDMNEEEFNEIYG